MESSEMCNQLMRSVGLTSVIELLSAKGGANGGSENTVTTPSEPTVTTTVTQATASSFK